MKKCVNSLIIFLFSTCLAFSVLDERNKHLEADQINKWDNIILYAKVKSQSEKLIELLPGLRAMGFWVDVEGHRTETDILFRQIQQEVLSIPGHAHYLVEEMERKRAALTPGQYRSNYDLNRVVIFETLKRLPSADTVQVLGGYLSDERDSPPPRYPGQDYIDEPATCHLATTALFKLGLRDVPMGGNNRPIDQTLKDYRLWWEEIKSGRKAFSFKGENVEYRFKPDGTWETFTISNPPDDGVKPVIPESTMQKASGQPQAVQPYKAWYWWPWLSIPIVLMVAVGWKFFVRPKGIR
jgi:hypothetical protein